MAQSGHGTEAAAHTGEAPEASEASEASEATASPVAGKIRVTVRRLDRLEATSVIGGRGAGFSICVS
jgi:hypothetical protein